MQRPPWAKTRDAWLASCLIRSLLATPLLLDGYVIYHRSRITCKRGQVVWLRDSLFLRCNVMKAQFCNELAATPLSIFLLVVSTGHSLNQEPSLLQSMVVLGRCWCQQPGPWLH